MSDKTDDLLISVSTDLSTVKRALKQLSADVGQTASGVQRQFDAMGKGIDQSLTPVQKRINEMVGLPVGPKLKEWKGALAEIRKESGHSNTSMQAMLHSVRSIGEQLALGVSPAQALTGQLSHLSYVASQPGGITGALKEVAAMAGGLVTSFPYATAAIAAGGAAFIAYEMIGGKTVKSVDDALSEHAKTIKALRDAYGIAGDGADDYARRSIAALESAQRRAEASLRASVAAAEKQAKDALSDSGGFSGFGLLQQLGLIGDKDLNAVNIRFAAFAEPINKLREQIKAGKPDFDAFQQSLDNIASTNPNLRPIADEILGVVDKAASGREALDNMSVALDQLTQTQIDTAHIVAQIYNVEQAAFDANEGIKGFLQILKSMDTLATGKGDAIGGKGSLDRAQANFNDAMNMWRRFGYDNDSGIDPNKPKTVHTPRARGVPKTADDRFFEDIQAIRDRTAALAQEQGMLSLSFEEQTKRKTALDLEATALKQVREEARKKGDADWQNAQLTPKQIADIDAVSEAYARQADELRKAQEAQQLQRDILKGAFDDLRSALDDGKLDWQDFQKIALNALDKIIDKIENDLIDSIMQANSATGGGGIGSIFSAIFGGGSSSNVFPGGGVLNSTGGLYDSGGYTGAGGKKQIAGIVHKGEVVFSQDDIARNGGVAAVEAMRRGRAIAAPQMPSINAPAVRGGDIAVSNNITIDARGAQQGVGEEIKRALAEYDRHSVPRTVRALKEAKTRGMVA